MSTRFMIYGANGYTGELIAREARQRGLSPVLAGRNAQKVQALADELGLPARPFGLDGDVAAQLHDVELVLHCAGPFSATVEPMITACAASGTHYADVTGEIDVFEYVHQRSAQWAQAGIVAMPGVGTDVVPTDCLAAMLARDLPDATQLTLAFIWPERLSPGTLKTSIENAPHGGRIREGGVLKQVPNGYRVETIDFPNGPRRAMTIPWGDVSTAFYSTGIGNIQVFAAMPEALMRQAQTPPLVQRVLGLGPVQKLAKGLAGRTKGPDAEYRARTRSEFWGQVESAAGETRTRAGTGPEGYDLTVLAALASVERILKGEVEPGAKTPSMAFGPDFVLEIPGMEIHVVD